MPLELPTTMTASVLTPGLELVLEQRQVPVPDADQVLVQVSSVGVCGSDLHYFREGRIGDFVVDAPIVLGHEAAGTIVAVGSAVTPARIGERVSIEPQRPSFDSAQTLAGHYNLDPQMEFYATPPVDGAFAEFVLIQSVFAHRVPESVSDDAAALVEPLSVGIAAARKAALDPADRVLISGAGPIGLMAIAVARHAGARKIAITDVSLPRLELARKLGVDLAVDVSSMRVKDAQAALGMREGFDVGLEMSGHPTALPEMIGNMNHGGRIAMLGLPAAPIDIDWAKVVTHMLTLKGIYGREMYETWYAMSAMLASNPVLREGISSIITDVLPATEWEAGFAEAKSGVGGKVVLDWTVF